MSASSGRKISGSVSASLLGLPLLLREGDKGERGGGGEKSVSVRETEGRERSERERERERERDRERERERERERAHEEVPSFP